MLLLFSLEFFFFSIDKLTLDWGEFQETLSEAPDVFFVPSRKNNNKHYFHSTRQDDTSVFL